MQKSGILILSNPDQVIPTDIVDKAMEQFPGCSGFAVAVKDEGEEYPELISETYHGPVNRDSFDDAQLKTVKFTSTYFFGKEVKEGEDVQPFLLVKGGDEEDPTDPNIKLEGAPALVGYFIGDFSAYDKPDSGHTAEYHAAAYLQEKLQKVFDDSGRDIEALANYIRSAGFKKEAEALYNSEGTVLLMDADGEVYTFGNVSIDQLDWGWHTPLIEAKAEPAPVAQPAQKRRSRFGMVAAPAAAPTPEPAKTEEPAPAQTPAAKGGRFSGNKTAATPAPSVPATAQTAVKAPEAAKSEFIYAHPVHTMSNNKTKEWYQRFLGSYADGFKDKPTVKIRREVWDKVPNKYRTQSVVVDSALVTDKDGKITVKSFSEAAQHLTPAAVAEAKTQGQFPTKGSETEAAKSDTSTHHVGQVTTAKLPIIGPEARGKIANMMNKGVLLKALDVNSNEVLDPKTFNDVETALPSFNEALGAKDFSLTNRWSYEMLCKLGRELPDALAKLCFDYRYELIKLRLEVAKSDNSGKILGADGSPITKKTEDVEVNVTGKVEEPVVQPAPKRRRFG